MKTKTLMNRAIPLLCAAACGLSLTTVAIAQAADAPAAAKPAATAPHHAHKKGDGSGRTSGNRLQAICTAADLDHDGNVSLDEFHQDIVQSWHSLGPDASGYVTLADLAQVPRMGKGRLKRLAAADKDGDGKLSFKEVVEARMAYFEAADADGNDLLSVQECVAYERQRRGSRQ